MLRKLVFLTALLASTTASAENWQLIEDATNGIRLVVDVDSPMLTPYQNEKEAKSIAVSALMAYIDNNESIQFVAGIDGDECVYKGAGTIINVFEDKTKNKYFWSTNGTKLYDAQGQWLCRYLINYAVELEKKPPAVKQNSRPKIKV